MTAAGRRSRTEVADALCVKAYDGAGGPDTGACLVAVGGYGRGELAPYSDLDVLLVHDDGVDPGGLARELWYPLWDAAPRLDHAVRSFRETTERAGADIRVALGLLDVRHLAGDPNLTLRLRTSLLAQWRRGARESLPRLRELTTARHQRTGELAHASVPDLKEAEGGVRDAVVAGALRATWLVEVPPDLDRARHQLLDLRDELHELTGRAGDRIAPESWPGLAGRLGVAGPEQAQLEVRRLGRRVAHLSRLAWRRADAVLARPVRSTGDRRPELSRVAPGVAVSAGEVVLDRGADPARDPLLLLRAAAEAAERGLVLAPPTAARLARDTPALPEPWPAEARRLLVRLLVAGPGLREVWETLDETGALDRLLPEWQRVRLLPHASVVHRWTVDRHVVETCVEASDLIREVARPDVLALAALLHDIGKGGLTEHSVAGEPIARAVARRVGLDANAVDLVGTLVRWHLLLPSVATTRDPDDPATAAYVADRVRSPEALSLLLGLTEADARATAPKAWSTWRAGLVRSVARAGHALLVARAAGAPAPRLPEPAVSVPRGLGRDPGSISFEVDDNGEGSRVVAVGPDRVGLLADVAAVLALGRHSVRGARAWSQDGWGVSVWHLAETYLDPAVLRQRYDAVRAGRADVAGRLPRRPGDAPATVAVRPEASARATVLEVRAADRPGVVHLVCGALAALGVSVRSAHVDTLGPQAVDVFYLQEEGAGALTEPRAAAAAHAVRAALED